MSNEKINSTVSINARIDDVWQALTNEDMLTKWYAPNSPWKIPILAKGEKMSFTLMPNAHNSLSEEFPMDLTIEEVIPCKQFSFSIDLVEGVTSFVLKEVGNVVRVESNSDGYSESLVNLKALVEGNELPYI